MSRAGRWLVACGGASPRNRTGSVLAGALQRFRRMLVFRSLSLGMLGACLLLLAFRPAYVVRVEPPAPPVIVTDRPAIIDVARGIAGQDIAPLIRLAPDEHVIDIDDRPVTGDLDAGAVLAAHDRSPGAYIDLTVATPSSARRVLVLFH